MSWDVNKLARREYDYIKGNTVLAPERKTRVRKPGKKYKQIQRRKQIVSKNILLRNRRKNDRKYILTVAVVIFSLGFITISGDNKVYSMENQVRNIDTQISQTQEENEALKVKILKFSSLNNIEKNAEGKLSMFIPKKEQTIKVDFSKNYFQDLKPKSTESNAKNSNLFSKIMNLIK
jgi:cell division protein FtsL